ncbi:Heparinase II/III-like protein [Halogranum amylolyticum]|uniref:Heparinase II/III-like protein n=1 Tax=Halogranum amylolyticum TaxID=660520 RepID=A0A1H8WMF3_9EURY|nr:heparinase II/III family protein [Halogranum amylolyticum]SEP28815.1 Heparinase II/III-like protein [Halogranum amylolyticum]
MNENNSIKDTNKVESKIGDNIEGISSSFGLGRRDFMRATSIGICGTLLSSYTASAVTSDRKTRSTFYTDAKRQSAQENIATYSWAQSRRDSRVRTAEAILAQFSLDDLWNYVGSQHIPRAAYLANGTAGYYPWSSNWGPKYPASGVSYATKPGEKWKITNGEYTLPTNDFEVYRQSGLDDTGTFDPSLADDSLLVNEAHPEMGPQWGVDNGLGWVDENGDLGEAGIRWTPVAWAHHWNVIYGLRSILNPLFEAYLYTEDQRYARAATVLLDRLADVYPEMDLQDTVYFADGGYTKVNGLPNPTHGGTGQGKQIGSIWESYWVKSVLKAYDAVFPALDVDSELTNFLDQKATEYPGLSAKDTTDAVRTNIEEQFIKQMLPGIKQAQIRGNFGSHQATLALSAVIQDDQGGYTTDALEFLFQAGELKQVSDGREFGQWSITGGRILSRLLSDFDRDGFPNEESIHYNSLVAQGFQGTAEVLNGYDGYDGADLYLNPILNQTFRTQSHLTFLNQYVPRLGDTAGAGSPGFGYMIDPENLVQAYAKYGDDDLVQWIYHRNGKSTSGLRGNIFDENPEAVSEQIETVLNTSGLLDLDSTQHAGFGFTALRAGSAAQGTGRGVWTYYGRNAFGPDSGYGTSHCHRDTLNLGLFGHGLNLAPDLGYPEETGDWPKRWNWTANTISHNTVVVNERKQDKQWVSSPQRFDHTDRVQVFDIEADDAYEETDMYRRATAQVTVDDSDSYIVDFFRVQGGDDHHFSFHGPAVPIDRVEYDLRQGVSEFVVEEGAGGVEPSREAAYDDDWSTCVFDPSSESHEARGLYVTTESDVVAQVFINSSPTGTEEYWHHVQAIYLGKDANGRHVCAGVGNHGSGQAPRIGIYYPDDDTWGEYTDMEGWQKRTWYALNISKSGLTVDISLQLTASGDVHASESYTLASATDGKVGIFGAIGGGQTGNLYFDAFTHNGTPIEFLQSDFTKQQGIRTWDLDLVEQAEGTYAGLDIPKPGHGEDTEYNRIVGNGFNYLYNVERDNDPTTAAFRTTWDVRDHWDVRADNAEDVELLLTMRTDCDDVAIASGDPPQRWNNPQTFKYLIAHRNGSDLSSVFCSVIEPYEESRLIKWTWDPPVKSSDPMARAQKVRLKNGRTDYIVSAANPKVKHRCGWAFHFDGAFAIYSVDTEGNPVYAYLLDGSTLVADGNRLINQPVGRIEGTIEDFTRDFSLDNMLQVRVTNGPLDPQLIEGTVGSWVYADAVDDRNGAYEIVGVENATSTSATLKIGERTMIKQFTDPSNPSAGYEYLLQENGDFVIPLSSTWSR